MLKKEAGCFCGKYAKFKSKQVKRQNATLVTMSIADNRRWKIIKEKRVSSPYTI
jgi:hypothetical protein